MSQWRVVNSWAAGEPPAFMTGGCGFWIGFGWLQTDCALKLSLLKSNSSSRVHACLQEIEPLGRIFVAVIVRAHVRAEHVELVLEPAAHDVEREPAIGDMIDGGRHLRHHQRMNQRHVAGRKHRDIVRQRAERGRPGEAFEGRAVEVRRAAVAAPTADRKQRFHAGSVDRLRDLHRVGPVELPGFRHGGDGGAMAAIESHDPELHPVAAKQTGSGRVVFLARATGHAIPTLHGRARNVRRGGAPAL